MTAGAPGTAEECKGCSARVRLSTGEVDRLVTLAMQSGLGDRAEAAEARRRLEICRACPDLRYGTTCRHCGCLVEVRVQLSGKHCAAPEPRW